MELNSEFTPQFLKEYQKLISESLKPVTEITRSFTVLQEKLSPFYTSQMQDLAKLYNSNIAASMSAIVNKLCYCKTLDNQAVLRNFSIAMQEAFQNIDFQKSLSEDLSSINEHEPQCFDESAEDYVTLDETSAKEWDIPETIAIPIGNHKIRIGTDLFVSVLLTVFFGLLSFIYTISSDYQSSKSEETFRKSQIQLEKEENQILSDIRDSIDTSNSSDAESINKLLDSIDSLQQTLLSLETNSQDFDSAPDEVVQTENNNLE